MCPGLISADGRAVHVTEETGKEFNEATKLSGLSVPIGHLLDENHVADGKSPTQVKPPPRFHLSPPYGKLATLLITTALNQLPHCGA